MQNHLSANFCGVCAFATPSRIFQCCMTSQTNYLKVVGEFRFKDFSCIDGLLISSCYEFQFFAQAYDFLQEDSLSEKSRHQRMKEQKEQYKQVRSRLLVAMLGISSPFLSLHFPMRTNDKMSHHPFMIVNTEI